MPPSPKATILSMLSSTGQVAQDRCSTPQASSKAHLAFCLLKQTHEALLGSEDGVAGSQAAHVVVHSVQLPPLQETQPGSELPLLLGHPEPGSHVLPLPSPSVLPGTDRHSQKSPSQPQRKGASELLYFKPASSSAVNWQIPTSICAPA